MSRTAQFALFFGFAVVVLAAIHFYLWFRLVRDTALPAPWKGIATWALVSLGASIPVAMGVFRLLPHGAPRLASALAFVWMGTMVLLVFFFFAVDALKLVSFAVSKVSGIDVIGTHQLLFRRGAAALALATGTALTAIAVVAASRAPSVTDIEVHLPRLPRALDGFSIVQISDLHIGGSLHEGPWLAEVVARVNALSPDLVAITGDLVDGEPEQIAESLAPLEDLRARHGVFGVTGNHEFYSGLEAWLPRFRALGVSLLRNERVSIGDGPNSFDLIGVDDYDGRRVGPGRGADLTSAVAGRDRNRAAVLLSHQPRIAAQASQEGIGLVLAGHTHGGQIWPFSALVYLQQPYLRGSYRISSGTHLYVSDGTGTWGPPMRLGTRNEIVRVVLRSH